jgi:hypothetical protein
MEMRPRPRPLPDPSRRGCLDDVIAALMLAFTVGSLWLLLLVIEAMIHGGGGT